MMAFYITVNNMRYSLIIFFQICFVSFTFSQQFPFVTELDTLYIQVSEKAKEKSFFNINHNNIIYKEGKVIGVEKSYNILDSLSLNLKRKYLEYQKKYLEQGILTGHNINKQQGIILVHSSISNFYINSIDSIKNKPWKDFTSIFFNSIDNVTTQDSVIHDKLIYSKYRNFVKATSGILLSESMCKSKNIFIYDGSNEKFKELKELIRKPRYIYILDEKCFNENNEKVFLFNEVIWKEINVTL